MHEGWQRWHTTVRLGSGDMSPLSPLGSTPYPSTHPSHPYPAYTRYHPTQSTGRQNTAHLDEKEHGRESTVGEHRRGSTVGRAQWVRRAGVGEGGVWRAPPGGGQAGLMAHLDAFSLVTGVEPFVLHQRTRLAAAALAWKAHLPVDNRRGVAATQQPIVEHAHLNERARGGKIDLVKRRLVWQRWIETRGTQLGLDVHAQCRRWRLGGALLHIAQCMVQCTMQCIVQGGGSAERS